MEERKSMSAAELVANATRIPKPTNTGIEDPTFVKEGIVCKKLDPRGHNVLERIELSRGIKPLDYHRKYDDKLVDKHIDEDTNEPIIIVPDDKEEEETPDINPDEPMVEDDSIIEFSEELDELEEDGTLIEETIEEDEPEVVEE